jgi:SAM-dependent methyltransferase
MTAWQAADPGPAVSYVVPNSWEHARQRLELLEACFDPASFRRASTLGVREGWRCLDAGAGHGSFARWLSARTGNTGSVMAADLDTRLLADVTEPNIEVRQMDLASDQLPRAEFDFIHTRMVLMHIRAREQILARLCAALRPGGTVMLEEQDGFPPLTVTTGPCRDAWLAFARACRAAGTDIDWARDRIAAIGEPGYVIDQGQADLRDAQRWFHGPGMVTAWGRRPPA